MLNGFDVYFIPAQDKQNRSKYLNDTRVEKLIDSLNKGNIEYIAQVILRFCSRQQFNRDFDNYEESEFLQTGNDRIYEYRKYLQGIYNERNYQKLNNLRSAVLERLVYHFKKSTYQANAWIETYIHLVTKTCQTRKSIDIGAWSQQIKRGECIECAISERYVKTTNKKQEIRELQNSLSKISNKLGIYFVSFAMTNALKQSVGLFSNINLIGRDKLVSYLAT